MCFGSLVGKVSCIKIVLTHPNFKNLPKNSANLIAFFVKIFGYPEIGIRVRMVNIKKALNIKKGDKVLDVGCGSGIFSLHFAKKTNAEFHGIDLDKNDIQIAKNLSKNLGLKADFDVSSATKLKFPSETFDTVVMSEIIEHIKDDQIAVKEANRVLKRGGRLIITTPHIKKEGDICKMLDKKGHVREGYTVQNIKNLLNDFNIINYWLFYGKYSILGEKIGNKVNRFLLFPISLFLSKFDFLTKDKHNIIVVAEKI